MIEGICVGTVLGSNMALSPLSEPKDWYPGGLHRIYFPYFPLDFCIYTFLLDNLQTSVSNQAIPELDVSAESVQPSVYRSSRYPSLHVYKVKLFTFCRY